MNKIVVLIFDTQEVYNHYQHMLKAEEKKGNIEVTAVGVFDPYAKLIDGWQMKELVLAMFRTDWDYAIAAIADSAMPWVKNLFRKHNLPEDRVFPASIFAIPDFDFHEYLQLVKKGLSIISNNCWGGLTYHNLKLPFESPFINLFLENSDYLKLLENLEYYLAQEVVYVREEKDESADIWFPVGRIDDVELHFNHYKTFEEAKEKWEQRKQRLNMQSLLVEMCSDNEDDKERFAKLPYKNKVMFTSKAKTRECEICIGQLKLQSENGIRNDLSRNVIMLGRNRISFYNALRLLNGHSDVLRVE